MAKAKKAAKKKAAPKKKVAKPKSVEEVKVESTSETKVVRQKIIPTSQQVIRTDKNLVNVMNTLTGVIVVSGMTRKNAERLVEDSKNTTPLQIIENGKEK